MTIKREAKKKDTIIKFVSKDLLDKMSPTGKHQGAIATVSAYEYADLEDILNIANEKGEKPFIFFLSLVLML